MSEAKSAAPVEAVAPAVEPTPAVTEAAPAAEATTETEAKPEEAAKAPEETPAPKEVKPIYEGKLSYNPGGNPFTAIFGLKKEYVFFFGEEAVPSDKLAHLIKPGKADLKETVAWSSETGKGLLYFAKHADQKDSPKGVIALADVDEVKTAGPLELTFKAHGHKHSLIAESHAALKGWEASLKEKIEEAKAMKDEIVEKSGYKETLEKLNKPAVAAAVIAKTETAPKKSSDSKSVERAARSSEATDKARPSIKERSQSRSKKLLSQLRGKKEAAKEDVKPEEAKESTEVPAVEAAPAETTETPAVIAAEEAAPAETAPAETEEPKDIKKEKQARRGSKFLDKIRGMASPTSEKKPEEPSEIKEAETTPAATDAAPTVDAPAIVEPAKETEPVVTAPEPAVEETPATNGDKAEEPTSPTTAAKEEKRRSSFFGGGLSGITSTLRKASHSGEKKPKAPKEEKSVEDVKPEEPVVEEAKPAEEVKPAEPVEETPAAAETAPEVPAKDAEIKKEKKENKFTIGGIQRSLSKALRKEPKEKKAKPTTEKVEEEKLTEEAKATETAPAEVAKEAEPKKEEASAPNAIGDVVPEAVHTGAPPASQTVSATA